MTEWYAGMKVEYWSPSYNEWIECRVGVVRGDGNLKLEHTDGSGVLKESADPSRVRPHADEMRGGSNGSGGGGKATAPSLPPGAGRPPGPPGRGGAPSAKAAANAAPLRKAPSAVTPPRGSGGASTPTAGDSTPRGAVNRQPSGAALGGPKAGSVARSNSRGPPQRSSVSSEPQQKGQGLDSTLNPKSLYVGDRVKLKGPPVRTGEVMYVGPASFANGDVVVGVKLDEKRSTSDCDGKYKNERYFRCQPGYGIYQPREDVELIPAEQADEDLRQLAISPAPDMETFDLETELESLVGLSDVKDRIKHIRNFIEVQQRRCSVVGDSSARALHFAFLHGGAGSGSGAVARLLGAMLVKLGVLSSGHVVEVTRRDLLAGCSSGEVEPKLKKVAKAAEGGVFLLSEADAVKDPEKSDRQGEEAVQALSKLLEGTSGVIEWPQRLCIIFAGKRGELQKTLTEYPSMGSAVFARLEFSDLTHKDIAAILRKLVEDHKFQLSQDLTDERLEALVRRRMARAGGGDGGGPKNVRLARAMLEEAVSRQTDRVWAKETLSYNGLTALVEEDFEDRCKNQDEAAQAALKKLDAVVGLRPVKEFVRSLYAQLQLEQQRREMGIEVRSSSTLHMVFEGNPGTGKTTVARVVAELLKALGLLRTGHLVEADRSALVAGYSGQTALKTKAVVESALGGVLFVDEAYSLIGEDGKDSFGREALDTLIKLVEDYRNDLVVILAGYSTEMQKLMEANPGLRSRFPTVLDFEDYSCEELLEIADQMLLQDVLVLSPAASEKLSSVLDRILPKPGQGDPRAFGNGRSVRNILERAKRNQALRLAQSGGRRSQEELCTLLPPDFDGCVG